MQKKEIIINVYGANWCSDCKRTKKYLGEQQIHYNWFDIELSLLERGIPLSIFQTLN